LWKGSVALSLGIFLAFSSKKDSFNKLNSIKDRRCSSCVAYPFFIILQRSLFTRGNRSFNLEEGG